MTGGTYAILLAHSPHLCRAPRRTPILAGGNTLLLLHSSLKSSESLLRLGDISQTLPLTREPAPHLNASIPVHVIKDAVELNIVTTTQFLQSLPIERGKGLLAFCLSHAATYLSVIESPGWPGVYLVDVVRRVLLSVR